VGMLIASLQGNYPASAIFNSRFAYLIQGFSIGFLDCMLNYQIKNFNLLRNINLSIFFD